METRIVKATDEDMKEAVAAAVACLQAGEIVGIPSETVYGLAADALNPVAVAKIFEAKERPSFDPLIVHVYRKQDLFDVADVPDDIRETVDKLTTKFWPGALTLILPKKSHIPDIVTSGLPTVAVRNSAHPVFRAISKAFNGPIAAPSANRFGRISPTAASAVEKELGGKIPLIIDAGACPEGLESTIISIEAREGKKPIFYLLRSGPVTKEDLQAFGKVEKPKPLRDANSPQAPGQLESHYAPRTPLYLFDKPEDFQPEEGKRYALLSYCGDAKHGYTERLEWESIEVLSPGSGKQAEAATRLFFALRKLDELGVDAIIAEPMSEVGLGVAMMDRLRRASKSSMDPA